jgi:hypothetical protein
MHLGAGGKGMKVDPSCKIFTELVNKNVLKNPKGVASSPIFSQPLYSLQKYFVKISWTIP